MKWFKAWLARRRRDRVVAKYVKLGLRYGDMLSYQPMGNVWGMDVVEAAFYRAETDFVALGYERVSIEAFVRSGGYGKDDVFRILRKAGVDCGWL